MNSLNSIIVEGNLTRDPILTATPKGTSVCTFAVASNRFFRQNDEQQKEVSFFDVETWARLGEVCGEQLKKGRGVRIVGRLKQDRWTDGEGKLHSRVKIVAEHVEFKPQFSKKDEESDSETEGEAVAETEVVEPELTPVGF
ncbi:MAG TPA: single-stranded DNA-binding protein [Spirochaetia bacterium]|nr:single-stranded DNA-binding protein [Spirochaetia bacterium]